MTQSKLLREVSAGDVYQTDDGKRWFIHGLNRSEQWADVVECGAKGSKYVLSRVKLASVLDVVIS